MNRKSFLEIVNFLFILLIVYAAVTKLIDYQKFSIQLGQSPILTQYASFLAVVIPGIELLISILLIIPRTRLIGFYSFFGMMIMFTAYIVLASRFSDYVPCSCGGVLENLTWNQHLFFNIGFIVLGVIGIILYQKEERHAVTAI